MLILRNNNIEEENNELQHASHDKKRKKNFSYEFYCTSLILQYIRIHNWSSIKYFPYTLANATKS
jgi:hypothetical protein